MNKLDVTQYEADLLSCPFCGSLTPKLHVRESDAWVECEECHGKGGYIRMTKEKIRAYRATKAADAWNRRR